MPGQRSKSCVVDSLGARRSPSPGSTDLVTPRASQKPPAWPWRSPSLAQVMAHAQLQGLPRLSVAFLQQPQACSRWFITAAGPNPARSWPWERCLSRGGAALTPLLAAFCSRSRRTTALAIASQGRDIFIHCKASLRTSQASPAGTGSTSGHHCCFTATAELLVPAGSRAPHVSYSAGFTPKFSRMMQCAFLRMGEAERPLAQPDSGALPPPALLHRGDGGAGGCRAGEWLLPSPGQL